ncbi:MAG: imidazole glycerol phosphate synthase subunit HisH [Alphaproteobacteria bacterium]|nr:imidazole glycerol phosphate synthase subunit HisH [Alphaproteobacteria bacterium]
MKRVSIVDFGAGNLLSVLRAFKHLDAVIDLASTPEAVERSDRLVLPGVGAFGACIEGLEERGLVEPVKSFAATGRPFLGICVGMQMLFEQSEEFGNHAGLGLIPGRVERIPPTGAGGRPHKVPHIGWNALHKPPGADWQGTPLEPLPEMTSVYFVHSFAARPANPSHRLAECDYNGVALLAATQRDNICGCQFHPEKSGAAGLSLLARFLELAA